MVKRRKRTELFFPFPENKEDKEHSDQASAFLAFLL